MGISDLLTGGISKDPDKMIQRAGGKTRHIECTRIECFLKDGSRLILSGDMDVRYISGNFSNVPVDILNVHIDKVQTIDAPIDPSPR